MTLKLKHANVVNAVLPQGEYQTYWAFYDDIDPEIFKYSYKMVVKSSLKSSFG